jgi:hypothetical protein
MHSNVDLQTKQLRGEVDGKKGAYFRRRGGSWIICSPTVQSSRRVEAAGEGDQKAKLVTSGLGPHLLYRKIKTQR